MCLGAFSAYISVYRMHIWCPQRPEEGTVSPRNGVTDGFEPSTFLIQSRVTCLVLVPPTVGYIN